jgi:hypothetical protein
MSELLAAGLPDELAYGLRGISAHPRFNSPAAQIKNAFNFLPVKPCGKTDRNVNACKASLDIKLCSLKQMSWIVQGGVYPQGH